MKIRQFRYNYPDIGDVFSYVLFDDVDGKAVVIDGGAVEDITAFLQEKNLTLRFITNTHGHRDHVCGNGEIVDATGAPLRTPAELAEEGLFSLGKEEVRVMATPGHSEDSVVFLAGDILVTGDTLFAGTIGNCYTGDYRTYFDSLKTIIALPSSTRIYPGHDLRKYAMGVAQKLTPKNPYITPYLGKYNPQDEWTTLEDELAVNPFIRWDAPDLEQVRHRIDGPRKSSYDRFRLLMEIH